MEQVIDSEESTSGCESGWTLYLQHSNIIIPHHHDFSCKKAHDHDHDYHDAADEEDDDSDDDDDDDDDMSMVSDASSGPPHFQEHDEDECDNNNNNNGVFSSDPTLVLGSRKRRKIIKQTSFHSYKHIMQDLPDSLDDTDSSPFFSFSNKDLKVCKTQALMEDDHDSISYSQGHSTTYFEISFLLVLTKW
ncbi:uncharacterized protein [Rutidosis leptorrhynchoides]|uniref:uncharacterized protein n=1 Tax=Rutidosis leptorrhynchoides TaxID=125765 RepID=UPI003A9975BA